MIKKNPLPDIDKMFLANEAKKVAKIADDNLKRLEGLFKDHEDSLDFFFGILRRQAIILYDLASLLESSVTGNLTGPNILCRCLCEDFINLFYLKLNPEETENIVRINAEAKYESFKSLKVLTASNEKHYKGNYPFYLNNQEYEGLKEHFQKKQSNRKYFKNVESFEFKRFMQIKQLAEKIEDFELSKISPRAYYLWSYFSGFVHYSNMTMEFETDRENEQVSFRMIEESIQYSFNSVELAYRHFTDKFDVKLQADPKIIERYQINYE